MKIGDRVKTPDGIGTIVRRDGESGVLARRFGVKLDKVPEHLYLYGLEAIYYMDTELKPTKSQLELI